MFVAGEAGVGKSSLLQSFVVAAGTRDDELRVAVGDCNAQGGVGDPYLPFREILASLTGATPSHRPSDGDGVGERLARVLRRSAEVLFDVGPDLIGVIVPGAGLVASVGQSVAERAGFGDGRRPERQSGVEQDRIFEQYANVVRALAEDGPLVIVVDDLQWADEASVGLLFHLSRRLTSSRVLIVGTYRPDEVATTGDDKRSSLAKVLAEIKRYAGDVTLDLGDTTEVERREFTSQLIDAEPNHLDDDMRDQLFARTAGHPLFTVELLRALQERGDLVRGSDGAWVVGNVDWDELPARVEGVIEERIGRLDSDERELVEAASVEGPVFTAEIVARLTGRSARDVLNRLGKDLDRRHHLVLERPDATTGGATLSAFQFVHVLFQKYLYSELGQAQRRLMHADVAVHLAELSGTSDELSPQLAWHYDLAGQRPQAAHYYTVSGRRAIGQGAPADAVRAIQRALVLVADGDPDARWDASYQLCIAYEQLGDLDGRRESSRALFELAQSMADDRRLALAYRLEARRFSDAGDALSALEPAGHAVALAQRVSDASLESESQAQIAQCLVRLGRVAEGHDAIGQALSALARSDSDAGRIVVGRAAWIVYYESGDMARSLEHATDAIAAARRSGDRGFEALMLNNLGLNLAMLGKYDEALVELDRSITTAKAAGWRRQHGYALQNLALVLLALDRLGEARQTVADSMVVFDGTGDGWGVAGSTYYTGLVLEARGDHEDAQRWHQQARDMFLHLGAAGLAAEASAGLARCAVRLGRHQAAVEHAEVTMRHFESFGGVGMESPVRAALGCAEAFEAVGDVERADNALRLGQRELTERADRIADEDTRATYVHAIAEHRLLQDRLPTE